MLNEVEESFSGMDAHFKASSREAEAQLRASQSECDAMRLARDNALAQVAWLTMISLNSPEIYLGRCFPKYEDWVVNNNAHASGDNVTQEVNWVKGDGPATLGQHVSNQV